jgi:hypothetical protein
LVLGFLRGLDPVVEVDQGAVVLAHVGCQPAGQASDLAGLGVQARLELRRRMPVEELGHGGEVALDGAGEGDRGNGRVLRSQRGRDRLQVTHGGVVQPLGLGKGGRQPFPRLVGERRRHGEAGQHSEALQEGTPLHVLDPLLRWLVQPELLGGGPEQQAEAPAVDAFGGGLAALPFADHPAGHGQVLLAEGGSQVGEFFGFVLLGPAALEAVVS